MTVSCTATTIYRSLTKFTDEINPENCHEVDLAYGIEADANEVAASILHHPGRESGVKKRMETPDTSEEEYSTHTAHAEMAVPSSTWFSPLVTLHTDDFRCFRTSYPSPKNALSSQGKRFIKVAQMLADQAASDICPSTGVLSSPLIEVLKARQPLRLDKVIERSIIHLFSPSQRLTLDQLYCSSIAKDETAQALAHARQDVICRLDPPLITVQRTGRLVEMLSSAVSFWEELSLSPADGSKNVTAFLLYPDVALHPQTILTFLSMIGAAYHTCNLGTHEVFESKDQEPPLLGVPTVNEQHRYNLDLLRKTCVSLGLYLASLRLRRGNFVIYIIYSENTQEDLSEICACFLQIYDTYKSALSVTDISDPNELVLQIVPSSLVYSEDGLVILAPSDYKKLAFQVYDRCSPASREAEDEVASYQATPAVRLSTPIPQSVSFQLTPNPSFGLSAAHACLHLGYTWHEEQWLTASWTNDEGSLWWQAAYWLDDKDDPSNNLGDVVGEIWNTTLGMLHVNDGPCRIHIVKDSALNQAEQNGTLNPLPGDWIWH